MICRRFKTVLSKQVSEAGALVIGFLPFVLYIAFLETTRRVTPYVIHICVNRLMTQTILAVNLVGVVLQVSDWAFSLAKVVYQMTV